MLYIIGVGFIFVIITSVRVAIGTRLEAFLHPALYNIYIDVSILTLLCAFSTLMSYFDIFDESKIHMRNMIAGLGIFIFI
jgi:hypothetical protein